MRRRRSVDIRQSRSKFVCLHVSLSLSLSLSLCVCVADALCRRDVSFRHRDAPDYKHTVVPIAAVARPLRFFETLSLVRQFLCLLIAS